MNENSFEEQAGINVEQKEAVVSSQEAPTDSFVETIEQVEDIQASEPVAESDLVVKKVTKGLHATEEEVASVKQEVNFFARQEALNLERRGIREKLEASLRRALVPLVTAFALGSSPALAERVTSSDSGEVSSQRGTENGEQKELKMDDVFDLKSPLALSSKKFGSEWKISSDELQLLKNLYQKALTETNEWVTLSGKDKNGKFTHEGWGTGPLGGYVEFENGDELTEKVMTHTHPVGAAYSIGRSAQEIRESKIKPFVMAPSVSDFSVCISMGPGMKQRVVDPRGVWEFECDQNHPFIKTKNKIESIFSQRLEELKAGYSISKEDFEHAKSMTANPTLMAADIFKELDKKYPGINKKGQSLISDVGAVSSKIGDALFTYESEGVKLANSSPDLTDKKLSSRIKSFIKKAEDKGMYLRYAPMKEQLPTKVPLETIL